MLDSKCGRNGGHEPSWLGVEFWKNIYGSDKTSTCEPENYFCKIFWANYNTVVVQIFLASSFF
jgi:hypothetical protein